MNVAVVKRLEELLTLAKNGDLQDFAYAHSKSDGGFSWGHVAAGYKTLAAASTVMNMMAVEEMTLNKLPPEAVDKEGVQ